MLGVPCVDSVRDIEEPIVVGNGFKDEFDTDGCWMLIEAVAQPD